MNTLMILFLATILVMGIFCLVILCRDVVIDAMDRRNEKKKKSENRDVAPLQNKVDAEKIQVTDQTKIDNQAENKQDDNAENNEQKGQIAAGNVVFDASETTLDEKYNALPKKQKGYYDEIVKCASSFEESRRIKNTSYEEYKIGKSRLVRLKIRRGIIVCELIIPNPEFKKFIDVNKVSVKHAPTIVKVTDQASLDFVKDSIRIAVDAINEEKEYKKEQKRLRRRELRAQSEQQATEQQEDKKQEE